MHLYADSRRLYSIALLILLIFPTMGTIFQVDGSNEIKSIDSYSNSDSKDWPMFRCNPSRTGVTSGEAPDTNILRWKFHTGNIIHSSPSIVDGRLYIGSYDFHLYCIDSKNGTEIWKFKTNSNIDSSPAVYENKVFIGSNDGKFYCLNIDNGLLLWKKDTTGQIRSSPLVSNGNVYVGSADGNLYCLNISSGNTKWVFSTDDAITYSSPALYKNKLFLATGGNHHYIYCINATTGEEIWRKELNEDIFSTPSIYENKLYIGVSNGLLCISIEDGSTLWFRTLGEIRSSPAVYNENIYIGVRSNNQNIYCINATNGKIIWSTTIGGSIWSSPAIGDGKLYIGSWDGYLYCIDTSDGKTIWKYPTGNSITSSPAIAEGKVFIGSYDKYIYCIGEINSPPISNFTYEPTNPSTADIIFFNDTSYDMDGYIVSWYWDFGDGNISTDRNTTHIYADNGVYNVTLTVTDNDNASATRNITLIINNQPPIAVNDTISTHINTPVIINVTKNDYDPDGYINISSINITVFPSNGSIIVNQTTGLINYTPSINYTGLDSFNYTIYDNDGDKSNEAIVKIIVTQNLSPKANFSFNPKYPSTSDIILFIDNSMDPDGYIVSWYWDFGDGGISTDRNATHIYADNGVYNVTLTVTDNSGLSNSTYKSINVSNTPPIAVNDTASTVIDTPVEINVTSNDYDLDGAIINISIISNASHGNLSIKNNTVIYSPDHNFIGKDSFTYIVIDDDNAKSNPAVVNIEVESSREPPHCSFNYTPKNPTTEDIIQFQDTSTDDKSIVSWYWDFGDGNISGQQNPTHQYKTAGTYIVTLKVEDSDGLNDTDSKEITVQEKTYPISIEIEYPHNNSIVNGTIEIKGKAVSDKPIEKIEIKIDFSSWITINGGEDWSYLWDTTKVSNGLHTIYARGYNGYSYSNIKSIQVTVKNTIIEENQPPIVEISFPLSGTKISGVIYIIGTAYDIDGIIQKVDIKIDNSSWITVNGKRTWEYIWNTSSVSDGLHNIYARSFDGKDYSSIADIQITVLNNPSSNIEETPQKTHSSLFLFILVMTLLGIVTFIPIFYIIKI